MLLQDFRALVERLAAEVPGEYLEGIVEVEVSPQTVPHPVLAGVYTMGECIPVETGAETVPSRVVLYHGSFQALARDRPDFDWREETWETLTHELRHHLEWRANTAELEAYDWAADQNFRRAEGELFDPVFYLSGERMAEGVYRVEEDVFWDRPVKRSPAGIEVEWHGRRYRASVAEPPLPAYVALEGLDPEPAGDAIVSLRRGTRVRDLFRRTEPPAVVRAQVEPIV